MSPLWEGAEIAAALGLPGPGFPVTGISIDTRTLKPGDLFVALRAERDGHEFCAEALAKGAAGLLVSRPVDGPSLVVADTLEALRQLGAAARARAQKTKIVAVTGSVGKTTTKEMLRRVLAPFGLVHAAEASFNNHIGVPLTLARLKRDADFGVFEIGMNHPGEILPLTTLVRPDAAIVTAVDRAHIGLMGSEAAIAEEKAAIFAGLAKNGTAIMQADQKFLPALRAAVPADARTWLFGEAKADAALLDLVQTPDSAALSADIRGTRIKFTMAAPGRHMAMNALAALAAAAAFGLDVTQAAASLEHFAPYAGRGARQFLTLRDGRRITLLDESYNASAASMRAALAVLALQPGRRLAVLGDMLELGDHAAAEHLSLRPALRDAADQLFACGPWTKNLFDSLPPAMQGAHAPTAATLAPLLLAALQDGDCMLVKGSYGSRMRDLVAALLEDRA